MNFLAIDKDLPLGRLQHTEQHFHQRRFTGAVLPYQGMDLTFLDLEIDVVIRHHTARIYLCDIPGFQDNPLLHNFLPFS